MAIKNQGFRRDLNLQEVDVAEDAVNALGGEGIAEDIRKIENNLRNTSRIGFNTVDEQGFFSFASDLSIPISKIAIVNGTITIDLTNSYEMKDGDIVELDGMSGDAADLNGIYAVKTIPNNSKRVIVTKSSSNYTEQNVSVTSVSFTIKPQDIFTFTNGDVIKLSDDVTFTKNNTTVSLSKSKTYYVVDSNAVNQFKLSETSDGSAISIPANATATPNNFTFIRSDAVYQGDLINYIEPEYQDSDEAAGEGFSLLENHGSINATFDITKFNINQSKYFMNKKYRGDRDMNTSDLVKIRGNLVLNDPDDIMSELNNVKAPPAPGIFIGETRAFSSDNNPWEKDGVEGNSNASLKTSSEEVKIGELVFLDGGSTGSAIITGLGNDVVEIDDIKAKTFTHKLPIKIQDQNGNQETYYLLLTEN